MTRSFFLCCLTTLLMSVAGCKRAEKENDNKLIEASLQSEGSKAAAPELAVVEFVIKPLPKENEEMAWLASYVSQGKTARFRIELGTEKKNEKDAQDPADVTTATGQGRFVSERGSDASALLAELKKVLMAKTVPTKVQRVPSVPFTFVSFGDRFSPAPGGGMNTNPPGKWTAMKLFLGEGENESQVFLNLDPTEGKGQFSIKDPDYGDLLLVQFAKVF